MKRYGEFPIRRNKQGQMLCKWCGGVVPKGRVYFCKKQCAFEVQIRRDSAFLRARTKERDHGVCAGCGIDTEQLKRVLRFTHESLADLVLGPHKWRGNLYWFRRLMLEWWGAYLWDNVEAMCSWQADHVVEVIDGGEPYLSNIQTLCTPCHKAKTARQAGERAKARRQQKQPLLAEVAA